MTQYWIEQLTFAVEVFDEGGNLQEVLARLHDLDGARAAYTACRQKYPAKLIYLCQGGGLCGEATVTDGEAQLGHSCLHQYRVADLHSVLITSA
jgi:hypothetical protein